MLRRPQQACLLVSKMPDSQAEWSRCVGSIVKGARVGPGRRIRHRHLTFEDPSTTSTQAATSTPPAPSARVQVSGWPHVHRLGILARLSTLPGKLPQARSAEAVRGCSCPIRTVTATTATLQSLTQPCCEEATPDEIRKYRMLVTVLLVSGLLKGVD